MGLFDGLKKRVEGVVAQVNPFDNGRTYNTVLQHGAQYAPQAPASVAHQVVQSAPVRLGTSFVSPVTNIARTDIINPIRLTAAQFSHNPIAYRNANYAQDAAIHSLGRTTQAFARTVPEAITSLEGRQRTYTPGNRFEKAVFGQTPIQNIEKKVVNNYQTHPDLPGPLRFGLAGLEAGGSILQDAPAVGGALKLAKPAGKTAVAAGKTVQKSAQIAAEQHPSVLAFDHQYQQLGKAYDQANSALRKKQISTAMAQNRVARTQQIQQIKEGGYAKLPGASEEVPATGKSGATPRRTTTGNNAPKVSASKPSVPEDTVTLYHASPKLPTSGNWQKGTYLADTPEKAMYYATSHHTGDVRVIPVTVPKSAVTKEAQYYRLNREHPITVQPSKSQLDLAKEAVTQPTQGAYDMSQGPPDFLKPIGNSNKAHNSRPQNYNRDLLKSQSLPLSIKGISKQSGRSKKSLEQSSDTPLPDGSQALHSTANSKTGARTSSGNYTTNPTTVKVPTVKPGDYAQVRANAQLASNPVEFAAGQVSRIARQAKLTTSQLGRLVEGTDKPANALQKEAVRRYRIFADRVHATSQALGGNTPYRQNYFHHEWDLSSPEQAAKFEQFRQRKYGQELNPTQFSGLDAQPRVFDTVAEGEAAGFKLKNNNAASDILEHGNKSAYALRQQALGKGLMEADINEPNKPYSFDVGTGKTIALSNKGKQQIRGFEKGKQVQNPILKSYRASNRGLKRTLLSASEFHPINITKKVAPALVLKGHPVLGTKGAYGAFRAQVGRAYSDKLLQSAMEDGTVDFGARIGAPLKYGTDYTAEGRLNLGKEGFGEKTIFEKSMPALQVRALQALKKDLDKKGISYDSPEAHAAGTRINEMMGFVNTEFRNLDKGHQKFLSDVALAPQFTRAKWATIKSALSEGGVAGSYARRAVVGDTLATAAVMLGLGYLAQQKSDNIKDLLIRALVHPSVPTPFKDNKGNNIELGMPSTYTSEALGLIANIKRGNDGHLTVEFKPNEVKGNLANYGRARLAMIPSAGLKLDTNTNYANKPLYDPNVSNKDKAIQSATTILSGSLPIGLQGASQSNLVKNHLPQAAQDVLTANTPGSNPLIKSIGSSFGLTPRTDKTVGKGKETTQYFDALDEAKKGLNRQEKDAIDIYTGGKKNPVTGKYDVQPSVYDASAKAKTLLQNPKVIDNLINMNAKLSGEGQAVDPLWQQPKSNIVKYLQYQTFAPGSADKTDWYNKNQSWYSPLADARNQFFASLPPGDPNKPKLALQYPEASPGVQNLMSQYDNLTDSKAKGQFLDNHPEVIKQWNAVSNYNNKLREALGYAPLKNYPEATPQLQSFMDNYSAADKAGRKAIRNSNPGDYQKMIAYFDSLDLYNINKQGALSQLQGEPDYTSKQAKAISSLAQDIYQNADGTYSIIPAGWMNGLENGFGGYGFGKGKSKKAFTARSSKAKSFRVTSGGGSKKPAVKLNTGSVKIAKAQKKNVRLVAKKIKNVV